MTTTASSTHSSTSPPKLTAAAAQRRALSVALAGAACGLCGSALAAAEGGDSDEAAPAAAAAGLRLERDAQGIWLSAAMHWQLPEMVQDALEKGIPVHFIVEAQVLRERWYWRDEVLLQTQRFLRLSYQPLTRRWRLYTGNVPFEGKGLGLALATAYEELGDALNVMQRLVRWRVGDAAALPKDGEALLQLRFRLDVSQFPRALQIGALGRADWNLLATESLYLDLGNLA